MRVLQPVVLRHIVARESVCVCDKKRGGGDGGGGLNVLGITAA